MSLSNRDISLKRIQKVIRQRSGSLVWVTRWTGGSGASVYTAWTYWLWGVQTISHCLLERLDFLVDMYEILSWLYQEWFKFVFLFV